MLKDLLGPVTRVKKKKKLALAKARERQPVTSLANQVQEVKFRRRTFAPANPGTTAVH